jgi:hypothetical protein
MSSDSPSETLYSSDGVELAAVNNAVIPTSTRGILAEGSDGYKAHFIKTDGYGDQIAALTDGYNGIVGVAPSSTAATAIQPALVVTLSPNSEALIAGNTAPTAANPALVVTISPNSPAQENATGSGTIAALNQSVVATAAGYGSIIFDITGTWSGTLTSQATNGDGTWINVAALSNQTGLISQTFTINGSVEMNAAGWTQARLSATAWTSGTATVSWSAGAGSHIIIPYSPNGINFQTNTALVDSNENFIGVTPASTAATAAEEALVVALSPNSPVPAGTNTIGIVNQGTGNATIGNAWFEKLTDGTNGPVAVKPASTASVAADPALVVTMSPNSPLPAGTNSIGTVTVSSSSSNFVVDRSTMVAGSQAGQPTVGQSSGVARIPRFNRMGTTLPGYQQVLYSDPIEGSNINTWIWTQSTGTMTISQSTGLLTLNAGAIETTTTYAIITSTRQSPIENQCPVGCSFKALIVNGTNSKNELGFGAPTTTTAVVNNGAFFRINNSGQVYAVTSMNGTENVSASLATLVSTTHYLFFVWIEDQGARFIVESSSGIPLVDYFLENALATPDVASSVTHLPSFARVYTSGTASVAPQTKISDFKSFRYDVDSNKPWAHQVSGSGRSAGIDPTTFAQTSQIFTTAPSSAAADATGVNYANLGGDFDIQTAAGAETIYGVFGYQMPGPYTLYITEIFMPVPFVTTTLGAGNINLQEWSFMAANSNNPSTATGQRYPLGLFYAPAGSVPGVFYTGDPITITLAAPIVVTPGNYFLILVKHLYGTTTGVCRGTIFINGYWE